MEKAKERGDYPLIVPKSYNGDGRDDEVEDARRCRRCQVLLKEAL